MPEPLEKMKAFQVRISIRYSVVIGKLTPPAEEKIKSAIKNLPNSNEWNVTPEILGSKEYLWELLKQSFPLAILPPYSEMAFRIYPRKNGTYLIVGTVSKKESPQFLNLHPAS